MSVASSGKNSWVKSNYEMLILVVVLVALLVSTVLLVLKIRAEKGKIAEMQNAVTSGGATAEAIDLTKYQAMLDELRADIPATMFSNRMFISEKRVACIGCEKPISYNAEVCPFCGMVQPGGGDDMDGDGMPDNYEDEHGFNSNNPDDADLDADNDGFTNVEEFRAETNPRDKTDRPPWPAKLRVVRLRKVPFVLRFNSVQEVRPGIKSFQLNLRTLKKTYFVNVGDVINDKQNNVMGIKILEFLPKAEKGPTLIVEKDSRKLPLVKDKPVTENDIVVYIIFLINNEKFKLKMGETMELRGDTYKVVDIMPDYVLLRDIKSGEESKVSKLSEQERDEIRGKLAPSAVERSIGFVPKSNRMNERRAVR